MARRVPTLAGAALLVLLVAAVALVWHPALAPAEVPERASFAPAMLQRGKQLAAIGYCSSCHTAAGGQPYAGGRGLETPFGTIYGTNITPDPETGIGQWSLAAFTRAMREGIDRQGHQLYPAFPYSHFTKLTDDDIAALYAFLMTRPPISAVPPPNALRFPYGIRPLIAGWNLLFLRQGPDQPDASKTEPWAHGAYLAEALAHCGACHSPRNALGAEQAGHAYEGGEAEDWWAPPLGASSPAPAAWTEEGLYNYLRSWDVDHAGAAGPMAPVVASLARVSEAEVRALAAYVAAMMPKPRPDQAARVQALIDRAEQDPARRMPGAAIYAGACAVCHDSGGQVPYTLRSLALHTSVQAPNPDDIVRAVVGGIKQPDERPGGFMPPFAGTLDDRQIADVVAYVRARFSDKPAWTGIDDQVHAAGGRP
jgi:mono/diheme cytochrome c family protein